MLFFGSPRQAVANLTGGSEEVVVRVSLAVTESRCRAQKDPGPNFDFITYCLKRKTINESMFLFAFLRVL